MTYFKVYFWEPITHVTCKQSKGYHLNMCEYSNHDKKFMSNLPDFFFLKWTSKDIEIRINMRALILTTI